MKQIADDAYLLSGFPPSGINVYLIGDVLLDAATRWAKGRILRQLKGRKVSAHALTHAHPDHQGASHAVCQALDIPYWVSEGDASAAESGQLRGASMPDSLLLSLSSTFMVGPGHPVARILKEGDDVAGFTVIETPGHSPGHLSYFREHDRLLIVGDVLFNMSIITGMTGLHQPPNLFTPNPAQNRDSARKLAALNPQTICFGHGPVVTDAGPFQEFVAALPAQ